MGCFWFIKGQGIYGKRGKGKRVRRRTKNGEEGGAEEVGQARGSLDFKIILTFLSQLSMLKMYLSAFLFSVGNQARITLCLS